MFYLAIIAVALNKPPMVIEKPEIEAYCEQLAPKADACISTSPLPFSDKEELLDECDGHNVTNVMLLSVNESKSTQTAVKKVKDTACNTTKTGPIGSTGGELTCKSCGRCTSNTYSNSFKFYTSLAIAGLFAFFFAVTHFSPEIHKSYSRPPPI